MNDVALIPVHELRANLTLSHGLAWWICAVEDGADLPESLPADIVAEAKRLLAIADCMMAPVPDDVLKPWLSFIATQWLFAGRGRTREETEIWKRVMVKDLAGMPIGVFTVVNATEIKLRNTFFPMLSQINDVLAPDRDQLERRANALRLVALKKGIAG